VSNPNRLLSRTLIGAALVLIVFGAVHSPHPVPLTALAAAWAVIATLEFIHLLAIAEIRLNPILLSLLNAATVASAQLGWLPAFSVVPAAAVFLAAVASRTVTPRTPVYGLFTTFYLGFLPAHLVMLKRLCADNHLPFSLVLFPLVLTWVSDTAAYAIGKLLGRRPLAPTLSPNKTVEGLLAGLIASALLAPLWLRSIPPFNVQPLWWLSTIGVGISAIGQAGDLFESMFKRAVGVKNSSAFLGEHGGFLDRCDSLLFAIPAFYYLTLLLLQK
jgi:phosphatidate cytidylyltransferase